MPKLKVKIINQSGNALPEYATEGSSGMDIRANLTEAVVLKPMERKLIPAGFFMELPRSGLAAGWRSNKESPA